MWSGQRSYVYCRDHGFFLAPTKAHDENFPTRGCHHKTNRQYSPPSPPPPNGCQLGIKAGIGGPLLPACSRPRNPPRGDTAGRARGETGGPLKPVRNNRWVGYVPPTLASEHISMQPCTTGCYWWQKRWMKPPGCLASQNLLVDINLVSHPVQVFTATYRRSSPPGCLSRRLICAFRNSCLTQCSNLAGLPPPPPPPPRLCPAEIGGTFS